MDAASPGTEYTLKIFVGKIEYFSHMTPLSREENIHQMLFGDFLLSSMPKSVTGKEGGIAVGSLDGW